MFSIQNIRDKGNEFVRAIREHAETIEPIPLRKAFIASVCEVLFTDLIDDESTLADKIDLIGEMAKKWVEHARSENNVGPHPRVL